MKNNIKTIKYIVFLAFLSMFVFTQINIKTTEASTCSTPCGSCQTTFSASCSADHNTADVGEDVTWTVNASGGTSAYTYSWSGTESLSGSSKSITGTYDYAGTKTANVRVTSGCKTVIAICSMNVVEPVQNLSVSCSANPNNVNIGEELTWSANATGGTGSYTYSWSGTESLYGSYRSITGTYDYAGTKNATVTVRSGSQTASANCSANIREIPQNNLIVSCSSDIDEIETGDSVRFTADVSGGSGSYTYSWSGTNSLSGNSRTITKRYTTEGEKSARITVTSDGHTASAICYVDVVDNTNTDDNLDVSCYADNDSVETGDSVKWIVEADGGSGSYKYSWSGTNSLSGSSRTITKRYTTEGEKSARVKVTSGSQTEYATCYADVSDSNQVLSYVQNTNQIMPLTSSVYLSDIPYTGAGDNIKIILFILILGLWGVFLAYYLLKKNINANTNPNINTGTNMEDFIVPESNSIKLDDSFKVKDDFTKNSESDNKDLSDIEDYARINKVLLSSSATEKILKLSRFGKVNASNLIKGLSTGEWKAVSDKDIKE